MAFQKFETLHFNTVDDARRAHIILMTKFSDYQKRRRFYWEPDFNSSIPKIVFFVRVKQHRNKEDDFSEKGVKIFNEAHEIFITKGLVWQKQ